MKTIEVFDKFLSYIESSKSCPINIIGLDKNFSHFTLNLGSGVE